MRILVSGLGIAGPAFGALAARSGHQLVLIDRAEVPRGGGQGVDVRGPALAVARELGVFEGLRALDTGIERTVMLDRRGREATALHEAAFGNEHGDLEIPRGELAATLLDAVPAGAERRRGVSIAALREDTDGVEARFDDGRAERFDLVVGSDGTRSMTGEAGLGIPRGELRPLGAVVATWALDSPIAPPGEQRVMALPGQLAMTMSPISGEARGQLILGRRTPAPRDRAELAAWAAGEADAHPQDLPRELAASLRTATRRGDGSVYLDVVGQRRLPRWTSGRIALLGNAAWAPSLLSGQGTPMALIGAAALAGALERAGAGPDDVPTALARYEASLRPHVARLQRTGAQIARTSFGGPIGVRLNELVLYRSPALMAALTRAGTGQLRRALDRLGAAAGITAAVR